MAIKDYNDALILNQCEMIDMCVNCECPEDGCDETPCMRFRQRYRELAGLPPLNPDGTDPGRTGMSRYTMGGEAHTLSEWARMYGVSRDTVANRVTRLHWPLEKALTVPVAAHEDAEAVTIRGITRTVTEWADWLGISRETVYARIKHGWSVRDALFTPRRKRRRFRRYAKE